MKPFFELMRNREAAPVLCAVVLFAVLPLAGQEKTVEAGVHGGHGAAIPGLKQEWIAAVAEEDFLRLGEAEKTVKIVMVATYTDGNHGMNFNGWSHGKAVWMIPLGWKVEVEFVNPSPVPHSLIVIEQPDTKKLQVAEPWFEGAAVAKHLQGIALDKARFAFTPDEEGDFAFACGFPAHAIAGHWVGLEVTGADTLPMLKLGDAEPRPASPAKQ